MSAKPIIPIWQKNRTSLEKKKGIFLGNKSTSHNLTTYISDKKCWKGGVIALFCVMSRLVLNTKFSTFIMKESGFKTYHFIVIILMWNEYALNRNKPAFDP